MGAIWQTAIHTPWWVYLLLIYLIAVGIKSSKVRIIPFWKVFVLPTIFLFISIQTLMTIKIEYVSIASWIVGMLVGSLLGWWQVKRLDIKIDKKRSLIQIPGSWDTLLVMLIVFIAKYYVGYEQATNPVLVAQLKFKVSMLVLSGVCTGLFLGRLFCYLGHYKDGKEADLI
ncbi:DUF6622 family protein [Pelosinus sp. UFO1]|uniref:DUF6622 family protein n=1 Tax=Pelosinus sp. UFO1 TaxID=484770 RepID=UPI0004D151BD|nr:DUF6622 family protein [Pelosinus sp. UFO1]AIF53155.1 hypothetical protein UFO1_3612 [Pelosinus sp. UFO1]